ncbi:hypothetical protein QJS04_geneDACA018493 [Acorus gramineus]|uniref:Uncharacterized protein n=1 Tax=Acorus gramineus TaxID=55184 RepID=A0AAV9AZV3_ACOGR|nr:hypothetical protein QJS04_geneDACA018493 [Acorus gramineus]
MAVIPVSSITFYSDKPSNVNSLRNYKRDTVNGLFPVRRMSDEFSSFRADNYNWRCLVFHHGDNLCLTSKTRQSVNSFYVVREGNLGPFCTSTEVSSSHRVYCTKGHVESSSEDASQRDDLKSYSLETSIDKGQLNALDSYFRKLDSEENEHQSACMSVIDYQNGNGIKQQTESPPRIPDALLKMSGKSSQSPMKDGLASLDIYFSKLSTGLEIQKHTSSTIGENPEECNPLVISSTSSEEDLENGIMEPSSFTQSGEEENGENFQDLQPYDEASDLYLIAEAYWFL